jgi:predicted nucleic acid-binding protein
MPILLIENPLDIRYNNCTIVQQVVIMITIDASAIIAIITNEPSKGNIIIATIDSELIAPESIHWEIGNAFSALLKRHGITLERTLSALMIYENIPIRFVKVELESALKIADTFNIYAYDAYLIECALKYRTSLLTLDNHLAGYAQKKGIEVIRIVMS